MVRRPGPADRPDHRGRRHHRVHACPRRHGRNGIAAGPDGNLWFTELLGQQDRSDHYGRRHHRVPDPHGRQRASASRPGRTATSGSPKRPATRSVGSPPPASSPSSPSPPPAARLTASRPGRTATSGSPRPLGQQDRPDHPAGVVTEFAIPTAEQRPRRHRARPGRQPLVHRTDRPTRSAHHPGRLHHRVPVPTADSEPHGIAAGPDGNLWFTECDGEPDRPDHPGGAITEFASPATHALSGSRPAPTATSGSPILWRQYRPDHNRPYDTAAHGCRCPHGHRQQLQRQRCARARRDRFKSILPGKTPLTTPPGFHRNRLEHHRSFRAHLHDQRQFRGLRHGRAPVRPATATARPVTVT